MDTGDDTLFVPETQESDCNDGDDNNNTQIVEYTRVASEHQGNAEVVLEQEDNIATI